MKKVLKILGIIFVVIFIIGFIGSSLEGKDSSIKQPPKENKETETQVEIEKIDEKTKSQKPKPTVEEKFTKENALRKIQDYQTTKDLASPYVPKGKTILEVYEIRGKAENIENLGWITEETDEKGKYVIGYKQVVGGYLASNPRWEVTKDNIEALNGIAIRITPEFGPKEKEAEGTDFEKQVYEMCKSLFQKYDEELFEKYDFPTGEQLEETEKRALEETAKKFGITPEKVKEIYIGLDMSKYQ
jgi:hypothetical protein